jgi:hypothetical protein
MALASVSCEVGTGKVKDAAKAGAKAVDKSLNK